MSSQGPRQDILERLSEWSPEEIQNNVQSIIQELLINLTGEDKGHTLQSVYALLVTCLPSLSLEIANDCLLRHAMPAAQLLFNESLEGIKLRLDEKLQTDSSDVADTLSSLLQVCIEILKCMESVLMHISSHGSINISCISSVPKIVASLMLQTFQHCRESEALYRDLFSAVADILGSVFRQCHQVQCCFFDVITSYISFDCSVETDILYLVDVLQILSEVGEFVMGLDIKTLAEHWKGYAKLVQLYLEPLRQRFHVAYPLNYLCLEIKNNLDHLTNNVSAKDMKGISRLLKTTSFLLKIVVKLCEQFGSGNDGLGSSHACLYQLLLALHRNSPPILVTQNLDSTLMNDIERHLIVAADPLLSHLIIEVDFKEEFFERCRTVCRLQKDRLPHLLLMLSVMKKLVNISAESKTSWLEGDMKKNIVGCLLEILKYSHFELSSEISLPAIVKSGEPPRNCDLYEALCCHCAGLILSLNTEQFQRVESLLLDSMLETFIWPALLSVDVLCICARAGSSELVLDQVLFLAEIISSLEPTSLSKREDCKFLSLALRRMCSFLGTKGKQTLYIQYPPADHPWMWQVFGMKNFSKEIQDSASQALFTCSSNAVENFLSSNPSVPHFYKMVESLYGLRGALELSVFHMQPPDLQQYTLVSKVLSLWHFVCLGDLAEHLKSAKLFVAGPDWLLRLVEVLCRCTEYIVHFMTNKEIIQILNRLDGVINRCQSAVKMYVSQMLHGLATKVLEATSEQGLVASKIALLFSYLLYDSNPIVQETALETFKYFAHFTAHECIVAQAVADNKMIQDTVSLYLQKQSPIVEPDSNVLDPQSYFIFQASVECIHKCELKKLRILSPELLPEKPSKKLCLESNDLNLGDFLSDDLLSEFVEKDGTDAASRIYRDVQFITSQCSFQTMPSSSQVDLKKALDELEKFVKL